MPVDLSVGPAPRPEVAAAPEPERVGPDDVFVEDLADEAPHVDESVVRALLRSLSGGVAYAAGDPDVPDHWRFSDRELADLTPPLTRIVNRRPQLRRAVARGDEAAVAMTLAGYVGRNYTAGRKAQEARREDEYGEADGASVRAHPSAGIGTVGPWGHGGNGSRDGAADGR